MNKKIAKKWSKALRSRKYKKGQGFLCGVDHNGNTTHCCLGVLCELYQEEIGDLDINRTNAIHVFSGREGELPDKVQKWAGMKSSHGSIDNKQTSLAALNDDNNTVRPFNKIANIIDNHWEEL
jgi:hypothetical protein